jgi:hypothetical protein
MQQANLIQSLVPTHYMYVISLSHISTKTNFKQITNLYNTLRETTFYAQRHVICCHSLTNVSLLFDHFQHRIQVI